MNTYHTVGGEKGIPRISVHPGVHRIIGGFVVDAEKHAELLGQRGGLGREAREKVEVSYVPFSHAVVDSVRCMRETGDYSRERGLELRRKLAELANTAASTKSREANVRIYVGHCFGSNGFQQYSASPKVSMAMLNGTARHEFGHVVDVLAQGNEADARIKHAARVAQLGVSLREGSYRMLDGYILTPQDEKLARALFLTPALMGLVGAALGNATHKVGDLLGDWAYRTAPGEKRAETFKQANADTELVRGAPLAYKLFEEAKWQAAWDAMK